MWYNNQTMGMVAFATESCLTVILGEALFPESTVYK